MTKYRALLRDSGNGGQELVSAYYKDMRLRGLLTSLITSQQRLVLGCRNLEFLKGQSWYANLHLGYGAPVSHTFICFCLHASA